MDSTFLKWEVYNWDTVCKVTKYGKVLFFNLIKPKILVPAYKLGFQKKDTTIFNYDSGILIAEEAQLPNKGKWSYSGSSSPIQFSAENNSTTEVHGLLANNTPGSWTVYWIVENAICPADTDIAYISSSVVHPYKGFSPGYGYIGTDGQSYDEVYLIEGIQYESNFKLTIISSWNKVVYSYQGAGDQWKGWDGKGNQFDNKGNDMPEGTYYYILEFRNQKLTGPILLRRKG